MDKLLEALKAGHFKEFRLEVIGTDLHITVHGPAEHHGRVPLQVATAMTVQAQIEYALGSHRLGMTIT